MEFIGTIFTNLAEQTGFATLANLGGFDAVKQIIMIVVACVLL